jgi:hypothetical protein
MSKFHHLPVSLPGADLMPYMSAAYRRSMFDAVFHHVGGFGRMVAWVEKDDENYGEFLKMYAKGAIGSAQVENQTPPTAIEDLLAKLDAGEHAKVVNADPKE